MTQQEPAAAAFASVAEAAEQAEQIATSSTSSSVGTFTRNSSMSIARLLLATAVGFLLPSFLIHRLPVDTYSAWVLILQMSAYVSYLDFGIQTGISKYVAEFEARKDIAGAGRRASAGLFLLIVVSSMGVVLTLVLAWRAPHLFHEMPASFDHGMQLGLILIGLSTAFSLFCSIFASIFIGLQRYAVPMGLALANKVLFVAAVMGAVYFHGGLAVMGALVALVNVTTGAMHFVAWRRIASHIRLSLRGLDYSVVRKMLAYCSTLATWSVAMLLISGLDVTIVGRYDFVHTGFYSIATAPTNFMLAIIGAALAPLMPAASASSVHRLPSEMGALLAKATRYTTSLLLLTGLPLMVGGYWILRIWVGHAYAVQVIGYMRILVLANILRNLCAPYANMLVATESQRFAIAGAAHGGNRRSIWHADRIGRQHMRALHTEHAVHARQTFHIEGAPVSGRCCPAYGDCCAVATTATFVVVGEGAALRADDLVCMGSRHHAAGMVNGFKASGASHSLAARSHPFGRVIINLDEMS
jgi:O-antigen/teichoic acid export membrane protein